ncbi:ATP synthase epsilon chain [Heterostelium album PN500]|uniref:ATP synthase epsilon chain n=1 Tax=Heterostelium pallidum (strain ATCC 26659 / Pp 5 / PN500) TaxID=670386 RepID=D3AYF0_HETP5|nr:ATP synthase epsilon chain [Heterostelium album PN500]EFA85977.1 ATP synthase epsilon chain [Heterostelium album PN500]|eukprot:XP_020438083.1 ATP synthase epsilon chain [Heterostelium album PN500]
MAGQYWRFAGLTYLEYINLSGSHLRNCLKEPFKAAAKNREQMFSTYTTYQNGKELSSITLSMPDLAAPKK